MRPSKRARRSSLLAKIIEPETNNSSSDIELDEADIPTLRNTLNSLPDFMRNKVFIFSVLGISNLSFVIAVIQFWGSDYMVDVLHISISHASIAYVIDCLLAPSIGVLAGGFIINCLGGYEKLSISYFVLVGALIASILTIPIPFVDTIYGYNGLLFGLLISGGMISPAIIGIILHSVPLHQRAIASSIMLIFCNLLGYIPAPFLYGLIYDYTSEDTPKLANTICMYFSIFGAVAVFFSVIARKLKVEENQNETEEDNHKKKSFYLSSIDIKCVRPDLNKDIILCSKDLNTSSEESKLSDCTNDSCEVKSDVLNANRVEI